MVEKIAELDDDLTVKFLEGETISNEELKAGLRKAVLKVKQPLFSADPRCGIKVFNWCLDAVIDYLPSPVDIPATKATDLKNDE